MRFVKHAFTDNSPYHRRSGGAISAQAMAPKHAPKSYDHLKKQAAQAIQKHDFKTSVLLGCRFLGVVGEGGHIDAQSKLKWSSTVAYEWSVPLGSSEHNKYG